MALDLSAASLVRSSSGLLFIGLGCFLAILARHRASERRLAFSLATFCIGFGTTFVAFNLGAHDPKYHRLFLSLSAAGWVAALAGLLGMVYALKPPPGRRAAHLVALAVVLVFTTLFHSLGADRLFAALQIPDDSRGIYLVSSFAQVSCFFVVFMVVAELALQYRARPRISLPLLAVGVGGYFAFNNSVNLVLAGPILPWFSFPALGLFQLAAIVAWFGASLSSRPRPAVLVPLSLLTCSLLGLLSTLLPYNDRNEDLGQIGVVRIGLAVAVAVAVLRYDLLGTNLAVRSIRRGTLAAAALATLFIVAQVMQNFLSAEYGLLTGGVIAGAVLFVASPIQRTFERMGERTKPGAKQGLESPGGGRKQEMAFREAVQLALRDRHMTREEEVHLFHVAEALGISAGRAMELRHDVEREKGVA